MAGSRFNRLFFILAAFLLVSLEQVLGSAKRHPELDPAMPSSSVGSDGAVTAGVRVMVKMTTTKDPFIAIAKAESGETDDEPSFGAMKKAWHSAWVGSQGTENGGWFVAEKNVRLLPILTPVGDDSDAESSQQSLSSLLLRFSYSTTSRIYVLEPVSQEATDVLIQMFKNSKFTGAVEFAEKDQKMTLF